MFNSIHCKLFYVQVIKILFDHCRWGLQYFTFARHLWHLIRQPHLLWHGASVLSVSSKGRSHYQAILESYSMIYMSHRLLDVVKWSEHIYFYAQCNILECIMSQQLRSIHFNAISLVFILGNTSKLCISTDTVSFRQSYLRFFH